MHGCTSRFPSLLKPAFHYLQLGNSTDLLYQGIGGAVWHGVKGFRNSPYGERRIGALTAIKARAPVLGGNFGVWGGLFSTFDCAVKGIRKKEDPYNASECNPPEVGGRGSSAERRGVNKGRGRLKAIGTDDWYEQLSQDSSQAARWRSEEG